MSEDGVQVCDVEQLRFVWKHWRFPDDDWLAMEESDAFVGMHGIAYHYQRGQTDWKPTPRGGYTVCYIYEDDKCIAESLAECSPRDAFCYALGRAISKGRALKQLQLERELRQISGLRAWERVSSMWPLADSAQSRFTGVPDSGDD